MQFKRRFWGYRRDQVEKYVNELIAEYEKKIQSLQAEYDSLTKTNEQLKTEISALQAELASYQKAEKAVAEAFIQAQMQATAIEEEAKKRAAEIEKAAAAEVKARKKELEDLRSKYVQAQEEFKRLLNKYKAFISDVKDENKKQVSIEEEHLEEQANANQTDSELSTLNRLENELPLSFLEPEE